MTAGRRAAAARTRASALRIGIVDTGVNPWHSHVRGRVSGCRVYVGADGKLARDGDFRDLVGHGTAVAGVIREALPEAELYAVRVFDAEAMTYPSLVARGVLRAVAQRCRFVNLSLALPPGPGDGVLRESCEAAIDAGCVLVASTRRDRADWLPASLPGVYAVEADDSLPRGRVRTIGAMRLCANGSPRDLPGFAREANLWGPSFACARALAHLALSATRARDVVRCTLPIS
jgi:subtilisin family serine protease